MVRDLKSKYCENIPILVNSKNCGILFTTGWVLKSCKNRHLFSMSTRILCWILTWLKIHSNIYDPFEALHSVTSQKFCYFHISIVEKKNGSFNYWQMAGETFSLDSFKFKQKRSKLFKRHMPHNIQKKKATEGFFLLVVE